MEQGTKGIEEMSKVGALEIGRKMFEGEKVTNISEFEVGIKTGSVSV